ncbi:hypothetical protein IWX64_002922 [Arthrobacter sp. CAN_A212]|uniref:hypothetical protein n=1 Tax=unclassified Arthrobacter TaxID=235627 RepID=UPI0018CA7633|nr:hypothetical protein [Arthrobacter sp. CAN_C5]MBP2217721.1 hypothetical protein [Arthrobacter sp. CAN_C5]
MAHPTTSASPERSAPAKQPTHSGEGHLASNLVTFAVMMVLFLGSIFALTFFDQSNVWAFAVCLTLFFFAFWIPQAILGRSDTGPALAKGDRKA